MKNRYNNIKKRLYRSIKSFNCINDLCAWKSGWNINWKSLSGYYHTNLERGGLEGGCQENARNFSTLNAGTDDRLSAMNHTTRYDATQRTRSDIRLVRVTWSQWVPQSEVRSIACSIQWTAMWAGDLPRKQRWKYREGSTTCCACLYVQGSLHRARHSLAPTAITEREDYSGRRNFSGGRNDDPSTKMWPIWGIITRFVCEVL